MPKAKKKSSKAPITMLPSQLNKLRTDCFWRAIVLFATVGMAIYGWKDEEIIFFIHKVNEYDRAANKDHYISMKKITEIVEEETGLKFKW